MAINGNRLALAREKKGFQSKVLAREIGASPAIITHAEHKAEHEFKMTVGQNLLKTLNASYEYLSGESDTFTPYIYAKETNNPDQFDVFDGEGKKLTSFFKDSGDTGDASYAGLPVTGSVSTGPSSDYIQGGCPINYGSEFVNFPSQGDLYVLRIDKPCEIGRTGDGLILSNKRGADVGDDVYFTTDNDKWNIGTILSNRSGNITINTEEGRQVINAFDIALIHVICGSVTPIMFLSR